MLPSRLCLVGFALLIGGVFTTDAATVTAPYTDTFQFTATGGTPANFVSSTVGTWTIQNTGGANFYQNTDPASAGASSSMLQFSNLDRASNSSFTMTTTFTVGGVLDGNNRVGLAAFATINSSTFLTNTAYLGDVSENGTVRLLGINGYALTTAPADVNYGNLTLGSTYTETLIGSFSGTTLNLSFTVSGLFNNIQRTVTQTGADTAPLTGQYFGFRNNDASGTNALVANFQSFSVAVPEPSTVFAGVLLGLVATVRMRRFLATCR